MIVFIDESGLLEQPGRARTRAPVDPTPVIRFHFDWKQSSVIACLGLTNCLFGLHQRAIRAPQIVQCLRALRQHLKQRLLIVWDSLRAGCCRASGVRRALAPTIASTCAFGRYWLSPCTAPAPGGITRAAASVGAALRR